MKSLLIGRVEDFIFRGIFIVVIISILLGVSGCKSKALTNIKIYKASSQEEAIVRTQANESIACSAPEFDDYFCMSSADVTKLIKKVKSCSRSINLRANKDYKFYEKEFK